MFKDQIGKTMKVYVDDMLVKSKEASDLSEMFDILRDYRMKFTKSAYSGLNPAISWVLLSITGELKPTL